MSAGLICAELHGSGLAGRAVCVHASLRSFTPRVRADDVIDGFLAAGCTLLVPAFSPQFAAPPPAGHQPLPFNSEDDGSIPTTTAQQGPCWSPERTEIDASLGVLPTAVLARPGRSRGDHPLSSFTALGSQATALTASQTPYDVFAPLRKLAEADGAVVLAGTDLTSATILHLAEEEAGRPLLVRWARNMSGQTVAVRHGGCSRGFERLAPHLAHLAVRIRVAGSPWRVYPAGALLAAAASLFAPNPASGTCAEPACIRCATTRSLSGQTAPG